MRIILRIIFQAYLNYLKWKLCMKIEINFSKLVAKIKCKYDILALSLCVDQPLTDVYIFQPVGTVISCSTNILK